MGLFWAGSLLPSHAQATLGGSADSIEVDRGNLSASRRQARERESSNYSVHELEYGAATVREYVTTSGIVFGLAWTGRAHPDLSQLLGDYLSEYQEALKQTPRGMGHRYQTVRSSRVIVQKWGHMRSLQGRAFDPTLIPSGVSPDEIK